MMYRKSDKERAERIETALTSLRLDIGVRTDKLSLHSAIGKVAEGLNRIEQAQDKLMQSHAALEKENYQMFEALIEAWNKVNAAKPQRATRRAKSLRK